MRSDRVFGVFWLLSGLLLIEESYRLNVGELRRPGSGLFPLFVGIFLVIVSAAHLIQTSSRKSLKGEDKEKTNYRPIFLCLSSLYAYVLIFEWLGFIPATFLLILFLLRFIEQKGWILVITVALLTATLSYALFRIGLQASLPRGILGI